MVLAGLVEELVTVDLVVEVVMDTLMAAAAADIVVVEEDRQINMQDMGEAHITQEMIRIMKQGLALAMVWSLLLLIVLPSRGYQHQKIQE